jgi:hypothetical protein
MALSAKENKPEDMNVLGVRLGAQKGRVSGYLGLERGESSESEKGTEHGLDYKGQIDITHTSVRAGIGYDFVQGERGRLTAKANLGHTFEDVDGYLQLATPYGTERMDIQDESGYTSLGGGLEGALKLGKNVELTAGVEVDRAINSDNVETELRIPVGVRIKW